MNERESGKLNSIGSMNSIIVLMKKLTLNMNSRAVYKEGHDWYETWKSMGWDPASTGFQTRRGSCKENWIKQF